MPKTYFQRRTVLGGTLLAALPRLARAQPHPVRIGVLNDAAGPYADSGGAGSLLAAQMAVADFGATVLGRPIAILHGDTQNKPDIAGALAREWYDQGVDMITDLPVTPVAAAVQQVARDKNRTVMITASAVSEFTSRNCTPISSHWADDTHAMAAGIGKLLSQGSSATWFFITVNFSFGEALQAEATKVIDLNGGHVIGSTKFPIGNADFSSQILAAQSSGAKVIGLASVGGDQVNLIKQAAEFGLQSNGAQIAGFLVYITDIHALGLDVAQGLRFPAGFYWDQSDASRSFAKRFFAERHAMPTKNQASIYAASLHFLKAMAQAGTDDPVAVNKAMRAGPVAFFGRPATLREDGRLLYEVSLYRVKTAAESHAAWDYYAELGRISAADAFLPISANC